MFLSAIQAYALLHRRIEARKLQELYAENYPKHKESDFFWQVQDLKSQNILKQTLENEYQIKYLFTPAIDADLWAVHTFLAQNFDLSRACFWSSAWYNQFSLHQTIQNFCIIEVEKEAGESVFYALKKAGLGEVFWLQTKEDEEILLEKYIFEAEKPIIVRKTISKAPIQKITVGKTTFPTTTLEKMLVDLYADEALLGAYKGAEQTRIFENALQNYAIDFKKIFAYSQRRGKEQDLKKYLFEHFSEEINQM